MIGQGWTDALRTLHPDERIYTFWDYFRNAYWSTDQRFKAARLISMAMWMPPIRRWTYVKSRVRQLTKLLLGVALR